MATILIVEARFYPRLSDMLLTGAQILAALGIHDMILLSNSRHSPVGLSGYGLAIVEERPIAVAD